MKKEIINLELYDRFHGDLNKLDLDKTFTIYMDNNRNLSIIHINKGRITENNTQLFNVEYLTGKNAEYAGMWIETQVNLVLDSKYIDQQRESLPH